MGDNSQGPSAVVYAEPVKGNAMTTTTTTRTNEKTRILLSIGARLSPFQHAKLFARQIYTVTILNDSRAVKTFHAIEAKNLETTLKYVYNIGKSRNKYGNNRKIRADAFTQ